MTNIRFRIIILSGWLVLFSILSRLLNPAEIGNVTIGLVMVVVVAILVLPRMPLVPFWTMTLIPIAAVLVIQFWIRDLSGDVAIFLAILEVLAVALTITLSIFVSVALSRVEITAARLELWQQNEKIRFALSGHESIYREVRRARNHQRPLAIISVGVDHRSSDPVVEKVGQENQRSGMKQQLHNGLSKMLCDELEDCAVIVQDNHHYLAVLPETLPEELSVVVERLRQKASVEVGVEIKIGVATLPKDGYTFEGLVDKATCEMNNDRNPEACISMEQYPLERRINS